MLFLILFLLLFFIGVLEIFFLLVKAYLTLLVSVSVALLDPALAAMSTQERLIVPVDTQVVLETADSFELLVTIRFLAGPNLVHSSRCFVSLVAHRVLLCYNGLESFIARLGPLLPLLDLQPRKVRQYWSLNLRL